MVGLIINAKTVLQSQWKGIALGIAIGFAGNWLFLIATTKLDNLTYRREAFAELAKRILSTHQGTVMSYGLEPRIAFDNLRTMYDDTKSHTGNPRFEGKRFENIIYDLERLSNDQAMRTLLERLKYISNDIPIFYSGEKSESDNDHANAILHKLQDYYCCIALAERQEDAIMCQGKDTFSGSHYCIYDGELSVAPERTTIRKLYPVDRSLLK